MTDSFEIEKYYSRVFLDVKNSLQNIQDYHKLFDKDFSVATQYYDLFNDIHNHMIKNSTEENKYWYLYDFESYYLAVVCQYIIDFSSKRKDLFALTDYILESFKNGALNKATNILNSANFQDEINLLLKCYSAEQKPDYILFYEKIKSFSTHLFMLRIKKLNSLATRPVKEFLPRLLKPNFHRLDFSHYENTINLITEYINLITHLNNQLKQVLNYIKLETDEKTEYTTRFVIPHILVSQLETE